MKKIHSAWVNIFWKYPSRLYALKVVTAISIGLIPSILLETKFIGAVFSLGVVAMALSETQVHPRSKLKTSVFTLFCFGITAILVELLSPYPVFFGIILILSTFILLLLGGINSHYQKVTFGILLLTVYTMLGINPNYSWYIQPIFLVLGGMVYGVISIGLLYWHPWRSVKELMSVGYSKLADYVVLKATLFPSDKEQQEKVRNQLAQINIDLSNKIDTIKFELDSFYQESSSKSSKKVENYYYKWELLHELHTRFASSHERYDLLSKGTQNPELIRGFGQLMYELGNAVRQYSENFLTDKPYQHPISLQWTATALHQLLSHHNSDSQYVALSLLLKNLLEIEDILKKDKLPDNYSIEAIVPTKSSRKISLKNLLDVRRPRFRFSVRLSLCYLVAYSLIEIFAIRQGAWVLMTCLIIAQQTYSATQQRLFERVLGTISGVILGVILNELLPTQGGQLILLLGSAFAFFFWLQRNYTISVVFITTFVLATFNIQTGSGVSMMYPRVVDTLIASGLVFLATRFLWPDWQYKRLPELLKSALSDNLKYFESVSISQKDKKDNLIKRKAHQSDNELTMAWKNMLSEPKRKRSFLKNAYNLSYLNHALLSYISAFDTQNFHKDLNEEEKEWCRQITELLEETLSLMNHSKADMDTRIEHYQQWENDLFDLKKNTQNPKIILIHNIGRTALELLMQTQELHKK